MEHKFEIEKAVFESLPKLSIFFAIVRDIDLSKLDLIGIQKFLEESWSQSREKTSKFPNIQSHPNIAIWRNAFQSLKISTKKYTCSVENMAKRASKADSKPFSINPLVDFYNAFSLKYLLPFGGFDLESEITKSLDLRFSKEGDKFVALDSDVAINVPSGEVLYASGNTVVTRHINWKQSMQGLIKDSSVNVCFMAEVLHGYPNSELIDLQKIFKILCNDLLKIEPELNLLNANNSSITY
jgi:DNA/RNA-binding domain of Phe-tRNA-synthetase-like protein